MSSLPWKMLIEHIVVNNKHICDQKNTAFVRAGKQPGFTAQIALRAAT